LNAHSPPASAANAGGFLQTSLSEVIRRRRFDRCEAAPAPDGTRATDSWFLNSGIYAPGLGHPSIAVGQGGEVYIVEQKVCEVRKITSDGALTTVAGTGKCAAAASTGPTLSTDVPFVTSLAVDTKGVLYLSDSGGNVFVVSSGQISCSAASSIIYPYRNHPVGSWFNAAGNTARAIAESTEPACTPIGHVVIYSSELNLAKSLLRCVDIRPLKGSQ
jgi:hypothetical protein